MKIENRTFIVSGGSSGLGLATVHDLLKANAYVSIFDRSVPPTNLPGSHVRFFKVDITQVKEIEDAVDGTVEWTQETGARLGGVVNCAGVASAAKIIDKNGEPHPLDRWDFTLAVNATGSFNLSRIALKHLVKVVPEDTVDGERGVIIFVSSSAAVGRFDTSIYGYTDGYCLQFEGQPGQTAYAASKGALLAMTLPMARDLARYAVRVVTVAPGVFASSMTANFAEKTRRSLESNAIVYPARLGMPDEFSRTVRWIVECPYVNGETIRLSGGGRLPAKL
ncbi:hypothetical protein CCMSSC00406_0004403 [Pleurotus cornucopiae]|uniref:Uncharacterized protein n=1 Tax=Pleurotus cornucopiae TaxID=5321 RepID=A0ACB7J233_PLECO|nr:hypothetical protein CCMSSC00406_0004403 [Pleurotus cornucopiae]